MSAREEANNLIKHGILVRKSMRTLVEEYGNVEDDIADAVRKVVKEGNPETALDAIKFASQIAVKVDSDRVKVEVKKMADEFERNHVKCGECGEIVHVDEEDEHIKKHEAK